MYPAPAAQTVCQNVLRLIRQLLIEPVADVRFVPQRRASLAGADQCHMNAGFIELLAQILVLDVIQSYLFANDFESEFSPDSRYLANAIPRENG